MAPAFFQKPEAALKRALELIHVGKEQDALETLHDTIKARRHKQWSQMHEHIMLKHLELCVNLRKPHVAKDALFQYKALTQQVAVESLEKVIVHLLALAEQKTEEAQKTSIEKVEEIDDLDNADAPEHLLLSVVSGAAAQDRMDRTVLSPWLRFLWDSYRNCLELLRNNAQVEQLYHRITKKSFSFCAKYQRRAEFRKLCDLLRLHLAQIQKHQHLLHVVKLSSAESLALMQETRLCQLDTAIQMELWQEAYRSAEDVHGMMQLSKDKDRRTVKPSSYANYYDKLALVFWKAGNRLFHAAALLQKFIICKDMKKTFTAEEATEQATRVLLATLSVPDGADLPSDLTRHLDIEEHHVANIRLLSNLLRLPIAPSRSSILKECARFGVPESASEMARGLYRLLENNFSPLRLTKDASAILDKMDKPEYAQYIEAIRMVTATKALKQISVIYEVISWERLQKVLPFYEEVELERFVVDVSKHRFVKAQIDHRAQCVRFGGAAEATLAGGVDLEEADGFTGDDAQLGVEGIRSHLELMYNKLRATHEQLEGKDLRDDALKIVRRHAEVYTHHKQQDYERIIMRRRKIETYKETSERVREEKSRKAAEEAARRDEQRRLEEKKRLEQENINIEKKKKEADKREVEDKIRADKMRKLLATSFGMNILREHGEAAIAEMDVEEVLREQRERLDRDRQQQQQRLQQQERKFDHWVRAVHLEETIERKLVQERRSREAPKAWNEYEQKRVQKTIDDHNRKVDVYNKLQAVKGTAEEWIEEVKVSHADDFTKKMEEWLAKRDAVWQARLAERADARRKERRNEWLQKVADEERRKKEEEERQKQSALDEQRRARRGDNDARGGRRNEFEEDSKADKDTEWRRGPASQPPRPAPSMGMERRGGPPMDRDRMGERPPMRERSENVPSAADRADDWRSGPRAAPPPPAAAASSSPFGQRDREGPSAGTHPDGRPRLNIKRQDDVVISREDFGTKVVRGEMPRDPRLPPVDPRGEHPPRRDGPPAAAAPEASRWERGAVKAGPPAASAHAPPSRAAAPVQAQEPPADDDGNWTRAGAPRRPAGREDRPGPGAGPAATDGHQKPAASQPWRPSHRGGEGGGPAGERGGMDRGGPSRGGMERGGMDRERAAGGERAMDRDRMDRDRDAQGPRRTGPPPPRNTGRAPESGSWR